MTTAILRTADAWWVETTAGAHRITTTAETTRELLSEREALTSAIATATATDPVDPAGLRLVSPVTAPCRVVAQMVNFRSHCRDSGIDPDTIPPTFFRKASGSIIGPYDDIVRPAHVTLLDYEVEIGLVIGAHIPVGSGIAEDLSSYVAGLVVTNDVSARNLQLPKTQFYEAKSYPTFTPVGPRLLLLDAHELARFGDLRLQLSVNGEIRQDSVVDGDMITWPLEALRILNGFQALDIGDLVLTGTPVGTALSAPPKPVEMIGALLPPALKWKLFFDKQAKNTKYLQPGDRVEVHVTTDDGTIDLGHQRGVVSL